ncbi:hypothetical protein PAXINDRAFT_58112, partial [Paxillus involutus ATCC 200175]
QNHYAAYFHDLHQSQYLHHNDSMGYAPANDVLPVYSWFLSGLPIVAPRCIQCGVVALQTEAAAGSCGIAAHNYIKSTVDRTLALWNSSTSTHFRDHALHSLIIYHFIA